MKFTFSLNESLFEEDFEMDDDFSMDDHSAENVPEPPKTAEEFSIADTLIKLINDEWEAIEGYNNAIAQLRCISTENAKYLNAVSVLSEIVAEENRHVGQLQSILKQVSPNTEEIHEGEKEASVQMKLVDGKLPVTSWETSNRSFNNDITNDTTELCTICDVDDEM